MSDNYVPTTEEMREYFAMGPYQPWAKAPMSDDARAAMFDRWLEEHDSEVTERARQREAYKVVVDAEGERIIRAKSKRSQPIEVTDAMVVAAADEIRRYVYPNISRTSPPGPGWIDQARAALAAALRAMKEPEK